MIGHYSFPRHIFVFFSGLFLVLLFGISFYALWWQATRYRDEVIAEHIGYLSEVFKDIHEHCSIVEFEHQHNYIDFLNVALFAGSNIGPMHVKYPEHWQGPYFETNLTMQGQYYQIVSTERGYYIVPGEGVMLANGKIIGKDIIFKETTDIDALIQNGDLRVKGKAMAARLALE